MACIAPIPLGRSEIIKMNLSPRLTFLMSSIPLTFHPNWFKEIIKYFLNFFKKTRISQKKLSNSRSSSKKKYLKKYSFVSFMFHPRIRSRGVGGRRGDQGTVTACCVSSLLTFNGDVDIS